MDSKELALLLDQGMRSQRITTPMLAKSAQVSYETARRAVQGVSGISLESTTKLLVAVGLQLVAVPVADVDQPKAQAVSAAEKEK